MSIFDRKNKSLELKELKAQVEELQKKGFTTPNENNEYIKQLYSYIGSMYKIIDFDGVNREQLVKYYRTNAQVRGIVNLIANSVAELSDYVELVNKEDKEIEKHWCLDLINKPNDRYNKKKLVKAWAVNRLLTGDAFTYGVEGVGLKKGQFSELYIMPSDKVEIVIGGLTKPIAGFKLNNYPYTDVKLTPDNVKMSFEYNPNAETFFGLSPLVSAASYLQILENGLKRQNTALLNGGVANLITPKPDKEGGVTVFQADQAEKEMNSAGNINKNKFIKIPLEVNRMGDTPTDLSILETSKDAVTALCFVYNIPIDIYLGQAKYENTKEAKKSIYEQAAIPLFNEWLEDMTDFFKLQKEGLRLTLNTDKIEVLKKTATEQLQALTLMNASINEKREYMGYEKLKEQWADQPIIPMGVSLGYDTFDINESADI